MKKIKGLKKKLEHSKAYSDDHMSHTKKSGNKDMKDVIKKFGEFPEEKKKLFSKKSKKIEEPVKEDLSIGLIKKKEERKEEKEPESTKETETHKEKAREIRIKSAESKKELLFNNQKSFSERPVMMIHPIKTGFLFGLGLMLFAVLVFIIIYSLSIILNMSVPDLIQGIF